MIKSLWIRFLTRFTNRLRLRPQLHRSAAARMANLREHEYRRVMIESVESKP